MSRNWVRTEPNPADYIAGVLAGAMGSLEILGVMGVTDRAQRQSPLLFPRQFSALVLGEDAALRRDGAAPAAAGVGLHLPVHMAAGALFALLASRVVVVNRALMGVVYGLAVWGLVWGVLFPRLRPDATPRGRDFWILGAAHGLFGLILGLIPMRWTAGGVERRRGHPPREA